MAARQVQLRSLAASDIDAVVDHYRREGGDALALDFIETLEQAVARIRRSPQVGSPRFAYELGIPELRVLSTRRFPYLIFYVPYDDRVDVWRVLHSRRDILNTLAEDH